MKTIKAKFILFSLLAVTTTLFLTSCEESSLSIMEPLNDEIAVANSNVDLFSMQESTNSTSLDADNGRIFRAVLEASKGKFSSNSPYRGYSVELTEKDLGEAVYNRITNMTVLRIKEDITISTEEARDIFCVPDLPCTEEAYTFPTSTISLNTLKKDARLYFRLRSNYSIYIR